VPPPPAAPATGTPDPQPLYYTLEDLHECVQRRIVIDTDRCSPGLFERLVQFLDMLSDKSVLRVQRERAQQDEYTREHTAQWEARTQRGWDFRKAGGKAGKSRTERLAHCHPWDPNAPNAVEPRKSPAEIQLVTDASGAKRLNDRVLAAITKWYRFATYGPRARGFAQDLLACKSDEGRKYNSHRGDAHPVALPNWPDERVCPQCNARDHVEERLCPLRALNVPPNVISRGPAALNPPHVVLDDSGQRLDMHDTPLCRLCGLYGHFGAHCVFCTLCRRHGHSEQHCGSGYLPSTRR
jgi:hypothetical protein